MRGLLAVVTLAVALAGCAGKAAGPHWPKSAGAITPDDPADDGGESLDPRGASDGAAAVEHGGEDLTSILDEPPVPSAPPPGPSPAASGGSSTPATPPDVPPAEPAPLVEEIIIVN